MKSQMEYHNPVLLHETVDGLNIKPDGVYVDVTFGGGGHSREILNRLGDQGKLYGFDQDQDAQQNSIEDDRFTLIPENFRYIIRNDLKWTYATSPAATPPGNTQSTGQ